jgi:ubiquinone/menaquinone biosynthesis C-methylase UbiE
LRGGVSPPFLFPGREDLSERVSKILLTKITKRGDQWHSNRLSWEKEFFARQRDPKFLDRIGKRIDAMNLPIEGRDVLDIGCGPGAYLHNFRMRSAHRLVGFDISPHYMGHVRELEPGVQLVLGSAHDLPFPDGSFDVVVLLTTLLHLDADRALGEVKRVLRPGGVLWVSHMTAGFYWTRIRYFYELPFKESIKQVLSCVKRLLEPKLGLSKRSTYTTPEKLRRQLAPLEVVKENLRYRGRVAWEVEMLARKTET